MGNKFKFQSIIKNADTDITRMAFVTLVIFIGMSSLRPDLFMTVKNFTSMGYQIPELGFYSIAMMMVILTGGRDLSIVGIGNLSGIIAAFIMHDAFVKELTGSALTIQILLGVGAALATGLICGLINGLIVAKFGISSMLVTMATSSIFTGIGIILTKGEAISRVPAAFLYFGNNALFGIPIPLLALIAAIAATAIILNRTKYGFEVKFVGSNALASHYTGMNNTLILIKTYLYSGLMCAICGLEILSRTDAAKADYAFTYTFQAILASVLGATNPNGGFAKVSCLALSLISLQFLSSGFNMLRLGGYFKDFAWGLLLLVVLSLNFLTEERRRRRSIAAVTKEAKSH